MSIQEWMWELDSKMAESKRLNASKQSASGLFSAAEWEEARKQHSEKVRNHG